MKRWYKQASAASVEGGFGVTLDGKALNTPARTPIAVPTENLARAIAEEWRAQGETIDMHAMRLTRLAATALDRIAPDPGAAIQEIAGYAATDLLCHRADAPADLRQRQDAVWQPVLDWAARRYGVALQVVESMMPAKQPPAALAALRSAVAALDHFTLAGLHGATTASGSLLLGLALAEGQIDFDRLWATADLDEAWQREKWGDDPLAAKRRAGIEADLRAAARFLALLR